MLKNETYENRELAGIDSRYSRVRGDVREKCLLLEYQDALRLIKTNQKAALTIYLPGFLAWPLKARLLKAN